MSRNSVISWLRDIRRPLAGRRRFPGLLVAALLSAGTSVQSHEGASICPEAPGHNAPDSGLPSSEAPRLDALNGACPATVEGTAEAAKIPPLKFADFYVTPLGPRGLEYTARVRELAGQRVWIEGYMVQSRHAVPGTLLLTPRPVKVDDCHYGLADDLPPQTLHVTVPSLSGRDVPFVSGRLCLMGRLELGPREQPDGRNFAVRMVLEEIRVATPSAASPDGKRQGIVGSASSLPGTVARVRESETPGSPTALPETSQHHP